MKFIFTFLILMGLVQFGKAQGVAIGTNIPDSSAVLDLFSTNKGFLPPRMSSSQILAIRKPPAGLIVYNTFYNQPVFFNGTAWKFFCNDSTMGSGDISRSLIAFFPFNGNFNDESGKGNNGVVSASGGSLTSDKAGKPLSAFNCDGNGQELIVNNNGLIKFDSALSVSFNVMPRSSGRFTYVTMVDYSSGSAASFGIGTPIAGNSNLFFSTIDNDSVCNVPHTAAQSNSTTGVTMLPNNWYNIICTFNKGVKKVYVNGSLVGTGTSNYTTLRGCPNAQLLIGGWWRDDPQGSLNGKIDEVRLYSRELNRDEIAILSK